MWVSDFMTERNCATPQLVYGFAVYITYFFNYIPIPFLPIFCSCLRMFLSISAVV